MTDECIITNQLIGHRKAYRLFKRVDIWQNTSLSMKDGCTFKLTSCKQIVSVSEYQYRNEGMKLQGWNITAWVADMILLILTIFFVLSGWNAETITASIDYNGRSSLFLFSIAFTASSVYSLWKTPFTTWTLHD